MPLRGRASARPRGESPAPAHAPSNFCLSRLLGQAVWVVPPQPPVSIRGGRARKQGGLYLHRSQKASVICRHAGGRTCGRAGTQEGGRGRDERAGGGATSARAAGGRAGRQAKPGQAGGRMGKRAAGRRAGGRAVRRGRKQHAQSKYGRGVKTEPARAGAGNKPTAGGEAGCGHVHSCPARRCSRPGRSRSGKPAHGVAGLMAPYLRWWAEAGRSQGAVARRPAQIEDHAHEVQQAKPMRRETD